MIMNVNIGLAGKDNVKLKSTGWLNVCQLIKNDIIPIKRKYDPFLRDGRVSVLDNQPDKHVYLSWGLDSLHNDEEDDNPTEQ